MRLKLTYSELQLLTDHIAPNWGYIREEMRMKNYHVLLSAFRLLEIRNEWYLKTIKSKPKYTLKLQPSDACLLITYYRSVRVSRHLDPYTSDLFYRVIADLDKQLTDYKIPLINLNQLYVTETKV